MARNDLGSIIRDLKLMGGPVALPKGHPSAMLAMQSAFTVPAGLLIAIVLGTYNLGDISGWLGAAVFLVFAVLLFRARGETERISVARD